MSAQNSVPPTNSPSTGPALSAPPRWPNLRTLWFFVGPYRARLLLGFLLGLGTTAAALATPLVTKQILDSVGAPGDMVQPIAVLLGLVLLGAGFGFAQAVLLGNLAEDIVFSVRRLLVGRFFRGRVADLQSHPTGEVVTRVTSDTVLLREATSSALVNLVNEVIALIGALVLMATLDLTLFLVALACIAVVGVLAGRLMPRIGAAQRRAQEAVGRLGAILEGGARAVRTMKAARAETVEEKRVLDEARESMRYGKRANRTEAFAWTIASTGIQFGILVILSVGAWRIGAEVLEVSTLVAFLLYAFQLVEPVSSITMYVAELQTGAAAAARIRETEYIVPEDTSTGDAVPRSSAEAAALSFEHVSFAYPGATTSAVENLSLSLPQRGRFAVVGPSGAGKTSLFSLLLGFYRPDAGTLRMSGSDYAALSLQSIRERIAYVEQETPLLAGTVRYNLAYRFPEASDEELWDALDAVRLRDLVESFPRGLDEPVSTTSLSGGQRQRIGVARAIVKRPDVLLLDEATAQLDAVTEAAIHDVVDRISSDTLVITIAHRLSTVMDADCIIVMDRGGISASGTHGELLISSPLYARLVEALRIGPAADLRARD
ncbi:Multidrug resistance ABC transporter ATP-binding/permease protein BmrA [Microbacterium foliorum]|nr:Multidrug resistance ABC transporter ATP-binding/permease protein BmrA [Microbacterium foliorum]CAH0187784.1 Multidrug resistance ABC transporter ATP-binding/permease protein BmrA [Microbacterium foliorum]